MLPGEGQKIRLRFNDLQHLDRFWIQIIFLLFEVSKSRQMYVWVPHFWFDLIHYEKDLEAQRAMKIAGNRMHMIIGADTYLDRLPMRYWARDVYSWSYARSPFHLQRNRYYDLIDDYIVTVVLDPVTTLRIGELFTKIKCAADMRNAREFEVICRKARAQMIIERSARKAAQLRRKFEQFFGRRKDAARGATI
jgi:hypothetical protein